jgi:hypothetical protein
LERQELAILYCRQQATGWIALAQAEDAASGLTAVYDATNTQCKVEELKAANGVDVIRAAETINTSAAVGYDPLATAAATVLTTAAGLVGGSARTPAH